MIKFMVYCMLSLDNDLGLLFTQIESRMLYKFKDISFKQNVKVQVKLIHFFVGFGLGLDFYHPV